VGRADRRGALARVEQHGHPSTTVTEAILRQTGPLSGVVGVLFGERTRRYMDVEAVGLKRRCEEGQDARPERD
jgi:hypothetical protein